MESVFKTSFAVFALLIIEQSEQFVLCIVLDKISNERPMRSKINSKSFNILCEKY